MRRSFVILSSATLALAVALLVLQPSLFSADERKTAKASELGKSPTSELLPISQVVLFNSGVGYFQREGTIEGNQKVDLSFDIRDINDLIKSMTLRDLDGGQVSAVNYDNSAPIERTLKSFAINLTSNPSFGQILNQARGEKVEVVLQQTNATQPGTLTGSIIGIEQKTQQVDRSVVNVECLNLWCADGMRSVKMSEVQRIRFLNAIMDSEFRKALETLALSHDTQKKTVSINFSGEGKRRVKVGYVIENPIWKTSYRLVLGQKKEEKPFLQGWAVVENPTDQDWNNVRMALISGRPISFQMNLYDPLYVTRPVVEPELFASLRPVTYTGSLSDGERLARETDGKQIFKNIGSSVDAEGKDRTAKFNKPTPINKPPGRPSQSGEGFFADEDMNLRQGVASAANTAKLGDYFQYGIDHAVTLPRQKSAMLPIVAKDVQGDRVSIFNENVHAQFPLLGLIFKNTTGMHLTQGPITVFDGPNYAGDARIQDLQKDEQRLLSYAIDLGMEVHAVRHSDSGQYTSLKVVKGIVHSTTKVQEKKTYKIQNRNDENRVLIVEHPNRTDFALTIKEKPWETARDVHRFKVPVSAGKSEEFVVSEERTIRSQIAITNLDDQSIRIFVNAPVTSEKVKQALHKAQEMKGQLANIQREIQHAQKQLNDITQDQDRLRKNLREMPPTAQAYKRYLQKFDDQETEIEKLRAKIKELQDQENSQRKAYDDYLANLTVE